MVASLRLFLDLGDSFTKGMVEAAGCRQRLRYPSVVASRLLSGGADEANLLLDRQESFLRPTDFEPQSYPRTRSYPGGDDFLSQVHTGGHPLRGARFAGWLAAAYGADRQLLGQHPTADNVDALVRKALLLCAAGCRSAEIVFVLDLGAKTEAVEQYVAASPRTAAIQAWSFLRAAPQRLEISIRSHVLDAAACALAVVPPEVNLPHVQRLLLIDIGYLRTKLAILSAEGCEHQEQIDGLGVSDCVRRILRDGQEQGLVEDEFAVIRALEQSHGEIEVAGRRFDIGRTLDSARHALEEELVRAARRVVTAHYHRRGEMCPAAAITGGGAALVGRNLAARLQGAELGLGGAWAATDSSFLLIEGARRTFQRGSAGG